MDPGSLWWTLGICDGPWESVVDPSNLWWTPGACEPVMMDPWSLLVFSV